MVAHHATHVICLNRKIIAEGDPGLLLEPDVLKALFGLHMGVLNLESPLAGHIHHA